MGEFRCSLGLTPIALPPLLTVSPKLCRARTRIEAWGSWLYRILLCWDNICGTPLMGKREEEGRGVEGAMSTVSDYKENARYDRTRHCGQ